MHTKFHYNSHIQNHDQSYFQSIQEYGIDYCYSQIIKKETDVLLIPDGCIDLLFYCDDQHPQIVYYGPMSKPQTHDLKKGLYFGVHFLPGEIPFIENSNLSIQKLLNHRLIIYGREEKTSISSMEEMILYTDCFKLQVALFKTYYASIYASNCSENKKTECVRSVLACIQQSHGSIQSQELSKKLAYSEQYINRLFKSYTGLTPKSYANLVRFQEAVDLLLNPSLSLDLIDISQKSGYYDQSHMIKAFKKYTNQTPQAFRKMALDT